MVPTVVILTFWTGRRPRVGKRVLDIYDHPTPIDGESTLPDCLRSLSRAGGIDRVVVICAATDSSIEHRAEDRVHEIAGDFPDLDVMVFGSAEMGSLHRRLEQLEFADMIPGVTLHGYGAVRNVGLIVGAALGCESVVFVDDDQLVVDEDFLAVAAEGLGMSYEGRPVLAKSGYYVDADGHYQQQKEPHWSDTFWHIAEAYNQALALVDAPPRLRVSPVAFGGCLALHRDMYCNVSFDPWVVRGEDTDYVINARMHGGDVFLDGKWKVLHQPPKPPSKALVLRQEAYRFVYEHRKLEFAKSQVDLRQVTPESMAPYPGEFLGGSVGWRVAATALLRALAGQERSMYLKVARAALRDAPEYARKNCDNYFAFQRRWPILMERIWEDVPLKTLFTGERSVDRTAITGRFPAIRND
ncbi:MAG: hypothetical protein C0418_02715 [Coriobacteriaceae bacterium]|nr:hypothetical protein [Coriobacteriaceae bacterium]